MIDLLELKIDITHKPFGNSRIVKYENSNLDKASRYSKKTRLHPQSPEAIVTSLNNGNSILIRCSPIKFFQGHNIFGSDNLIGLGYHVICYVLQELKVKPTSKQLDEWKKGDFILQALDITSRFKVDSHNLVSHVIKHVFKNTDMSFRQAVFEKGIGISMQLPRSSVKLIIYDKHLEFKKKQKKEAPYLNLQLKKYAKSKKTVLALLEKEALNNIRVELKIDKKYLKNNNLNKAFNWNPSKVKEVYTTQLSLFRLGGTLIVDNGEKFIDQLTKKSYKHAFFLWSIGENLDKYRGRKTLINLRKSILKEIGVDIKLDTPYGPMLEEDVDNKKIQMGKNILFKKPLDIAKIFDRSNMLSDSPDWLKKYPNLKYSGKDLSHITDKFLSPKNYYLQIALKGKSK